MQEQDSKSIEPACLNNLVYLENGRYRNSFQELDFLGKGGFGEAHKVIHKLDGNFYAIKKIRLYLGLN